MREKQGIINEIHRVAKFLDSDQVSQGDFEKHGTMSVSSATYVFGSWNRAITAAGLIPFEVNVGIKKPKYSDEDLMQEIIALTKQLRKRPSDREMGSFGRFSPKPYVKRWGSFVKAREATYEALGFPDIETAV